ncbi:MAG TPA: TlpA disulfide reductase family protein [Paraburkholderia sp.]|jgi:thiol-disulfide isomerase/thioredoxin|nr:TlpA disulfide reductase family protein [Paraburkholderia sp.]
MNLGLFSLPIAPLILFASVAAALLAARFAGKAAAAGTDNAVFMALLVGLVAARLVFVGRYLPAYEGSVLKMLDFRDLGFDGTAGVVAGAAVAAWLLWRRRAMRRPLAAALVAGVATWSVATAAAEYARPPQTVPAVQLVDDRGQIESLARRDGKPLVVNLWATWCPPCQAEMPSLAKAQAQHAGIDMVFVNQGETRDTIAGFLQAHDIRIEHSLLDPRLEVARAVKAAGYPTTLFYDAQGRLVASHLGPFSAATFQQALEQLYPQQMRMPEASR